METRYDVQLWYHAWKFSVVATTTRKHQLSKMAKRPREWIIFSKIFLDHFPPKIILKFICKKLVDDENRERNENSGWMSMRSSSWLTFSNDLITSIFHWHKNQRHVNQSTLILATISFLYRLQKSIFTTTRERVYVCTCVWQ